MYFAGVNMNNLKEIQLQYEGYYNTPLLWHGSLKELSQLELPQLTINSFQGSLSDTIVLGKRVERFVSHELQQHEDISVLAENIQIHKDKITIGEIDAIITRSNSPVHLEIVYKFYLYDPKYGTSELEHWIGPNRKDLLVEKLKKLKDKQLPLLYKNETEPFLKNLHLTSDKIDQLVYFKAQLYIPLSLTKRTFDFINPDCIVGFYISYKDIDIFSSCKFYIPSKRNWLTTPYTSTTWLSFEDFKKLVLEMIEQKRSPLCWLKKPNGELLRFFIVWW